MRSMRSMSSMRGGFGCNEFNFFSLFDVTEFKRYFQRIRLSDTLKCISIETRAEFVAVNQNGFGLVFFQDAY